MSKYSPFAMIHKKRGGMTNGISYENKKNDRMKNVGKWTTQLTVVYCET